jgi:hypothetical protein
MSTLKADTIQNTSGGAVTLTNQSAAKAWCQYGGASATVAGSFNISSIDDDGVGDFGVNFSSSMSGTTYAILLSNDDENAGTALRVSDVSKSTITASGFDMETVEMTNSSTNRTNIDLNNVFAVTHGDLA